MSSEFSSTSLIMKNLRVLVVDDDADILFLAKLFLESAGCVVMDCLEPKLALAALETESVDLLLTDFRMPGSISGLELAHLATRLHPQLKVIIATGMGPDFCQEIGAEGFMVLEKPYNRDHLVRTIQTLFAE
ncbi:response regulator [Vampirovibrio sp.]|uniref:response regulator n=1 Tax=Vampirovibrio sp. TaxID=2717857 RepID=UPI0035936A1B